MASQNKESCVRPGRLKVAGMGASGISWEAEFFIGLFKELRNDFPGFPFPLMSFEKGMFSGCSPSNFPEAGHNFLDSIGKVMAHAFDKHLFHVIVEAE